MAVLRKLLFPFSLLYGFIVLLRNKLYDWEIKKSTGFDVPVICVGNLSVGGTGKSPMMEYLIRLLKEKKTVATLSRGYKRESKGFYLLTGNEKAAYVGDEPLQFKTKFPGIQVAVDEKRVRGIEQLLQLKQKPEVILLDDAFQHRKVKPNFSILLTTYNDLFINDFILPAGNLREPKNGAKRANVIVVTKCALDTSEEDMKTLSKKLKVSTHQQVFFTSIRYPKQVYNLQQNTLPTATLKDFTLVTGIANPQPLLKHLDTLQLNYKHLNFPDHYNFKEKDISALKKEKLIITTEKDFMRLKSSLKPEQLYYLPMEVIFLKDTQKFEEVILRVV